jgi:HSP20 family protein
MGRAARACPDTHQEVLVMADLPVHRAGSREVQRQRSWDPFQQMQELMGLDPIEQMGRWLAGRETQSAFVPAFEVKETQAAYVFKADLPGVDEKDLDISLHGDRLTIGGKRESERHQESDRFYAYERSYGSFSRSFTLPEGVDADHVVADLKQGVLTLTLPKRPEVQPRRITVGGENKAKA